jgi:hypothetical protein
MSLYQVDKLLFALFNDLELQENYKQNPVAVLKRYDLQGFRNRSAARLECRGALSHGSA